MTYKEKQKSAFKVVIGILLINALKVQQNVADKSERTAHDNKRAILVGIVIFNNGENSDLKIRLRTELPLDLTKTNARETITPMLMAI